MGKITRLELLNAAVLVSFLFVLTAAGVLGFDRATVTAIFGCFLVAWLGGIGIHVHLSRAVAESKWLMPVPDRTGSRIFEAALGSYLVLMCLLSLLLVSAGFKVSTLAGIFSAALALGGLASGRVLQSRVPTSSMWTYCVMTSLAVILQFLHFYSKTAT